MESNKRFWGVHTQWSHHGGDVQRTSYSVSLLIPLSVCSCAAVFTVQYFFFHSVFEQIKYSTMRYLAHGDYIYYYLFFLVSDSHVRCALTSCTLFSGRDVTQNHHIIHSMDPRHCTTVKRNQKTFGMRWRSNVNAGAYAWTDIRCM